MTHPTYGPTGARARAAESPALVDGPVLLPRARHFAALLEALPRLTLRPRPGRRYLVASDIVPPPGTGPGGRPWCAWCHEAEVVKGRRRYCSPACQGHAMSLLSNLSGIVYERDGGCCRACGLDMALLEAVLSHVEVHGYDLLGEVPVWTPDILQRLGLETTEMGHLHHIDHIVPVELGGTSHPDNLQTLCIRCHADKTAHDAARIAQARRGRQEGAALELALDAKAERGRHYGPAPAAGLSPRKRIERDRKRKAERRARQTAARQAAKGDGPC